MSINYRYSDKVAERPLRLYSVECQLYAVLAIEVVAMEPELAAQDHSDPIKTCAK